MILHCVFCNIAPSTADKALAEVLDGLSALCDTLNGALSFEAGPNRDFEAKSPNHGQGFIIRFADAAALEEYANDPRHIELGGQLCSLCTDGAEGIIVYDLEI